VFLVLNRIYDFVQEFPKYKFTLLAEAVWQVHDGEASSTKFGQAAG